ncbi:MAG: dTDP-Rha--alpha-D-GlcNAc-pyrophosphate polyprenol alpha-3-L-rhamnosyltransferase [Frankiales bacterium]|nr:dTDP-Rha--alpha-D-GlcNAc-pyrophosphate polyprenol alpha-3-L-rhamnosyltransferase [Frankiales bacterium]
MTTDDGPDAVSVVVVTYSPGESLAAFLDSLPAATKREVEVVLVDNGSTDGAPERAAQRANVQLLSTGQNLGYGRAANLGLQASRTEWTLIANPDVVLHAGAIDALYAAADRWPRAGALGPLIHTPDGAVYPSARAVPSLSRGIGHALFADLWPSNPWTTAYRRENEAVTERTAGWLSGSCLMLRRDAFESTSGFDPKFFMYFEDVDLGERLERAGWQNVYVPTASVTHLGGQSTQRHRSEMLSEHHRSAWSYLSARYPGRRHAPLRWAIRLGLWGRSTLLNALAARSQP